MMILRWNIVCLPGVRSVGIVEAALGWVPSAVCSKSTLVLSLILWAKWEHSGLGGGAGGAHSGMGGAQTWRAAGVSLPADFCTAECSHHPLQAALKKVFLQYLQHKAILRNASFHCRAVQCWWYIVADHRLPPTSELWVYDKCWADRGGSLPAGSLSIYSNSSSHTASSSARSSSSLSSPSWTHKHGQWLLVIN